MPHLVILYTPQLDRDTDMTALCHKLADTMIAQRDESGKAVFPVGGTRVLAYPAAQYAVADGEQGRAFVYMNMRVTPGRSDELIKAVGDELLAAAKAHLAPVLDKVPLRLTLHIDATPPGYEGKFSS